jgi:hypothetical protein
VTNGGGPVAILRGQSRQPTLALNRVQGNDALYQRADLVRTAERQQCLDPEIQRIERQRITA